MPQVFTPRADMILRLLMLTAAGAMAGTAAAFAVYGNPGFVTTTPRVVPQPVMFSHEHHAGRLGLDCRYCHTGVEDSSFAGIPEPETCMNCHLQLYTRTDILAPIRDAWRNDRPLPWQRVHNLPDFVNFSHSVHVRNGVACVSCHGRVDELPLMSEQKPLTMGWCLRCHRDPQRERVDEAHVADPRAALGTGLSPRQIRGTGPDVLTNCSACHY